MKRVLTFGILAGILFVTALLMVWRREAARYSARLAQMQAAWQAEKAELESALAEAREQGRQTAGASVVSPPTSAALSRPGPREIIARLQQLRVTSGAASPLVLREAVYWLEELALIGAPALPAIREFLARYEDQDLDGSLFQGRGPRDQVPLEFALPPSLRIGLLDVVRRIGGSGAEAILAENLVRTGRGFEVAYLTRILHRMAPDQYREQALSTAHKLLVNAAPVNTASPLDRNHRDYLYSVLAFYGDTSFATTAQEQLVRTDSQIDRGALKYLQQTLGPAAVPIVAQAYQHPGLTNGAGKEPLVRLALSFVGADVFANQFYEQAINDPILTRSHRSNLIEDLNEDGFADPKNLKANDLPLIQNRLTLIEQLAPKAMDEVNAAAFKEAYKDLVNMRDRLLPAAAQK